ncbi:MAG TPA: GerMN domain-containing protein [Longimicrobiales bacterium]|nr:GerMN domain-containing protein [Longimicrobiales bacterium]
MSEQPRSNAMKALPILVLLLSAACAEPPPPPGELAGDTARADTAATSAAPAPDLAPPDSLLLVFTKGERPDTVSRPADGRPDLESALELLLRGPLPEERARGLHSWFSAQTAGALRSVSVDSAGRAVVDFRDLRPLIPNASTSAGSAMLLHQLDGTVFQFPHVRSVEYRMEGSCALFWEWLQRECNVVTRPG